MTYHVSCNAAGDAEPTEVGRYLTEAFDVAQCWEDQPEAKALLASIVTAERIAAAYRADKHLDYWADDIDAQIDELKNTNLYSVRNGLIAASFGEDSDPSDYDIDQADRLAPSIEDALNRARKNGMGLTIAPFSDGADLLAAQVYQLGTPCLGAARKGPQL